MYYKTLSNQFITTHCDVDTQRINYARSITPLSPAQQIAIQEFLSLYPHEPVENVIDQYNQWAALNWQQMDPNAVSPQALQIVKFPWEWLYEWIRLQHFAHLPSRLESYFLFNDLADAKDWQKRRTDYVVCQAEIIQQQQIFTGDMYYLDAVDIGHSLQDINASVSAYWQQKHSRFATLETLVQGKVRLTKLVTP